MSDEESIGEELEFEAGSDDEYQSDDDYYKSEEPSSINVPSSNNISPIKVTYRPHINTTAQVPVVNNVRKPVEKDESEYSMDFSDAGNETYYSENFDDVSVINSSPTHGAQKLLFRTNSGGMAGQPPVVTNSQPVPHQSIYQQFVPPMNISFPPPVPIPTMSIQALQTEVAVEQLSREVVRLRNQHRSVLRQRRDIVEGKKARADERRSQYNEQLNTLQTNLSLSQSTIQTMQQQIDSMKLEKLQLIAERQDILESSKRLESTIQLQTNSANELRKSLEIECTKHEQDRVQFQTSQNQWKLEKEQMLLEMEKLKLYNEVTTKSMEAVEARMIQERNQLPAFYQTQVDNECTRYQSLAQLLLDKEIRLKSEEELKLSQLELLRKELFNELNESRVVMRQDVDVQRSHLEKQRLDVEASKTRLECATNAFKAEQDTVRISLLQQQQEIEHSRKVVERQRAELDMSLAMVQPDLLKIQSDRDAAEKTKTAANLLLSQVTEQSNALLTAEANLLQREKDTNALSSDVSNQLEMILTRIHQIQMEEKSLSHSKKQMQNDKFMLHQCMMEMHKQMDILKYTVKQSMSIVTAPVHVHSAASSSSAANQPHNDGPYCYDMNQSMLMDKEELQLENKSPSNQQTQPANHQQGKVHTHNSNNSNNSGNVTNILFTLEQSSQLLHQLMQQTSISAATDVVVSSGQVTTPSSHVSAGLTLTNSQAHGHVLKPSNIMQTYEHCSNINKQLMQLGKKNLSIGGVNEVNDKLLVKYHQFGSNNSGISGHYQSTSSSSTIDTPVLCLHSVLDDISNDTNMLNSIALKYSTI